MVDKIPLDAAGYAAGELTSEQSARFEELMRADESLARDVAFWRTLRTGVTPAQPIMPRSCPDLTGALLRRAALERQEVPARILRLPRWVPILTAAAACLALGVGFGAGVGWSRTPPPEPRVEVSEIPASEPIAYGEDGAGIMAPAARISWAKWMPLASIDEADGTRPLPMTPTVKPWIGLWTRQARLLIAGNAPREAHLVVRIVEDSPAWQAGLRPGDMIVAIDSCAVDNATCLGEHLAASAPGKTVDLEFWSASDAAFRSGEATLTAARE